MRNKKKKNKKNKNYLKAVNYYEKGNLDKAIELCDVCICDNLRNSSALNLKGLILYSKGDLEGARSQWKINSDHNDDALAKNYLFDSLKDVSREKLYVQAEKDIKELKIDDALNKLMACRESDFNTIKVNLALAICYYRKADYASCSVYLTNVLSIDRKNESAKKLAKDLKKFENIKLNINRNDDYIKYVLVGTIIVCVLVIGAFAVKAIKSNVIGNYQDIVEVSIESEKEDKLQEEKNIEVSEKVNEEIKEEVPEVNDSKDKGETKVEEKINFNELSNLISEKRYDDVYDILQKIKPESLSGKEKSVYYNGKELLEKEGVDYFYKKGYELYLNKSYAEASVEFTRGCTYGKENYLYQHLVFFNAACFEAVGDIDNSIKYYEDYYREFKDSDYIAEAVYKLAILYKNRDLDLAVAYAQEIKDKYPSSMYNNDIISELIDSLK